MSRKINSYTFRHYYRSLIFLLIFLLLPSQGFTADISVLRNQILNVCPQNKLTGRECAIATQKAVRELPDDMLLSLLNNIGAARFLLQAKPRSDLSPHKQTRFRPVKSSQLDQSSYPVRESPHNKLPLQQRPNNNRSIPATKSVNDTSVETRYKSYLQQQQQLKEALRSPQSRDHLVRGAANYLLNTASMKQYSRNK